MKQSNTPHLCGGTLYALILQARKPRRKARDKQKGGTDNLTAQDVFAGLTKVLTGEDVYAAGGTLAKCASLYKTCQESGGVYVPFTDPVTQSTFDSAVKSKNPVTYERMTEFIEKYLNQDKCEWLVRALIDTIQQDSCILEATRFETDYNQPVQKTGLGSVKEVVLQAFLVSVLHYVVMNAPDAESGRPTFEMWFYQSGKKAEWKYCGSIGDSIQPLRIWMRDYDSEAEGIDIGHADEDEEEYQGQDDDYPEETEEDDDEIMGGVPLVFQEIAPDLSTILKSKIYMVDEDLLEDEDHEDEQYVPFVKYMNGAGNYYSDKKTLLNREVPRPFYDLFVCNDLKYHKQRYVGEMDENPEITISNGTVQRLETESKYIIIEGTGGIGKSMYLTHLFLTCIDEYQDTGTIPIFAELRDYTEDTLNVLDFLLKEVREYDAEVTQNDIISALEEKRMVLLLDGLDEIQTSARDNFFKDLEAFVKSYSGNTVIMTSRPVYNFVSYAKFSLFDIQPLTIDQAVKLIEKLEFWDEKGKRDFIGALERHLYTSHYQFASNPLLLTIMLMTYSIFGEVPAKMHVFYAKAYETMARLHDTTKGSFTRPLYTGLTPEDFAKYYAEFCARTYIEEKLEFDEQAFNLQMAKVIAHIPDKGSKITPRDFLMDLTDNLCIMYREGQKYYFIHRSFQEYFAAFHFAYGFEQKLTQLGEFFDEGQHRSYSDRTFDMLYDMVSEKVEQLIFYPMLNKFTEKWKSDGSTQEYWNFLEDQYPTIYIEEGETSGGVLNSAHSYIYDKLTRIHDLSGVYDLDKTAWPEQVREMRTRLFYEAYKEFVDSEAYEKYPDPVRIPETALDEKTICSEEDIPYRYYEYFGAPDRCGSIIEVDISELRKNPGIHKALVSFMEQDEFPLKKEYLCVNRYFSELEDIVKKEQRSKRLFDD